MNLQRLDLTSLSLFTLVVRTGSISQGAALAHLAIGAASDMSVAFAAGAFDVFTRQAVQLRSAPPDFALGVVHSSHAFSG